MRHHTEPIIGNWYDSKSFPESFVVVDCDQDEYVEIQYLHGELDKIDYDAWDALAAEEIPEPEDATAPYGVEHDEDITKLLNEIEEQKDLDEHMRFIDRDEESWE